MITTLQQITSVDWSMALDATIGEGEGSGLGQVLQGIADVEQCLGIICTTPRGSDPLRPTFALDLLSFIDQPMNIAIPALVRELADAITTWEPRIILLAINATPNLTGPQAGAQMLVSIRWRLNIQGSPVKTTLVTIPWGGAG
jgi:phage baseplate assembly protein W